MQKQTKLSSYFPTIRHSHLPVFLYDATTGQSHFYENRDFMNNNIHNIIYLNTKCGYKLYLIENKNGLTHLNEDIKNIKNIKNASPLQKSNLQKAIRRGELSSALASATWLWINDPLALYRRLPIIMVEDVKLFDFLSTIVWWMMACEDYLPYRKDTDLVYLHCMIEQMCRCPSFFSCEEQEEVKEDCEDKDKSLISLYLRLKYGGMKGDMKLLERAISYYRIHPEEIKVCETYSSYEAYSSYETYTHNIDTYILDCAFDFHPYPNMLWQVQNLLKK